jgi:hypothetical protein
VHDIQVFEELLDEKDQAVLADSAYNGMLRARARHPKKQFPIRKKSNHEYEIRPIGGTAGDVA